MTVAQPHNTAQYRPHPKDAAAVSVAADPEIELSIVLPCLNEARTLGQCIDKARSCLLEQGIRGEIIVADNGSTDGSVELARGRGARVVHVEDRGYGAALAGGFEAARGRYILMADSDDSYDLGNLAPFVAKLREGYDLVMGNRFKGGIEPGAMPPLHRYFGNPLLTAIGRLFFKSRCGDFYCGQRAFTREAVRKLGLQATGMEFALEMLVKATMSGLRITEVPVVLSPDGRDRAPHLRSWRDGWRSLRLFLLYSPRWLFLYPGMALMLAGLVLGAWLLGGSRRVMGVTLDVHTLFYCAAAVVLGFQLIAFAVFGKYLSVATGVHPQNRRLERWIGLLQLESGLVLGVALMLLGVGLSGYAVYQWAGRDFGDLDPFGTMRIVIPAVLALTLGVQIIFSSFYLSLLQVHHRAMQRRRP